MGKHFAKIGLVLAHHPKAMLAGEAMATYAWAITYCRFVENDGLVDEVALRASWCGYRQAKWHAKKLVEVGLWRVDQRGGWSIENYDHWNDLPDQIEARRASDRDRKTTRNLRTTSAQPIDNVGTTFAQPTHNVSTTSAQPDNNLKSNNKDSEVIETISDRIPLLEQSRAEKEQSRADLRERKHHSPSGSSLKSSIEVPDDVEITPAIIANCALAGVREPTKADVVAMLASARDKGRTSRDWGAALVRWMCQAKSFEAPRTTAGTSQNENAPESIYGAAIAKGRGSPYSCPSGAEPVLRKVFAEHGFKRDGSRASPDQFAAWLASEAEGFAEWLTRRIKREPDARRWYSDYAPKGFQKYLNDLALDEAAERENAPILGAAQ